MNCIQGLYGNLHQRFALLHYLVKSTTDGVNHCAPSARNSKAFDAVNFISILESAAVDFHSLPNACTHRMLGINHCPRIFLEDEHRLRWTPKVVEEQFERDLMLNLRKLIDLLESMVDLLLILFHINLLRFFEWVEVVRELQSAYSVINTF